MITQDTITFKTVDTTDDYILISGYANKYVTSGEAVVDMEGTIISPAGIDLSRFEKNPIILYEHVSGASVGRATVAEVREDGLYLEAKIFKDIDPIVYAKVKNGVVNTMSVGMIPTDGYWSDVFEAYVITECQLFEVSLVDIPSNEDSVIEHVQLCDSNECTMVRSVSKEAESKLKAKAGRDRDKAMIRSVVEKLLVQ